MKLGSRLREFRKKHKRTLRDVSAKTHISVSFLSDIERNRTLPSLETLQALADSYHISLSGILSGIRVAPADIAP